MFRKLAVILLIAVFALVSGCGRSEDRAPVEGALMPSFDIKTLDGNRINLPKDLKQLNILVFWGSESKPSKRELKMISALVEGRSEVQVITINIASEGHDPLAILRQEGIKLPVAVDDNEQLAKTYEIDIMPTTFVIDKSGLIKKKIVGGTKEQDLRELLK